MRLLFFASHARAATSPKTVLIAGHSRCMRFSREQPHVKPSSRRWSPCNPIGIESVRISASAWKRSPAKAPTRNPLEVDSARHFGSGPEKSEGHAAIARKIHERRRNERPLLPTRPSRGHSHAVPDVAAPQPNRAVGHHARRHKGTSPRLPGPRGTRAPISGPVRSRVPAPRLSVKSISHQNPVKVIIDLGLSACHTLREGVLSRAPRGVGQRVRRR